jgi:hypothetical protein
LGLIDRCGFLLGHGGKKEGAAEGLSGEKSRLESSINRGIEKRSIFYFRGLFVGGF